MVSRQVDLGDENKEIKTHFAIFGQINLQRLGVILESKRGHGKENIFPIDRLAFLLLTLFGCCATLVNSRRSTNTAGSCTDLRS